MMTMSMKVTGNMTIKKPFSAWSQSPGPCGDKVDGEVEWIIYKRYNHETDSKIYYLYSINDRISF